MKVSTILDHIDGGSMALPEFQRGYVWNSEQVRNLLRSMYFKYPVGSLLVWVTKTDGAKARGNAPLAPGTVKLLLDGQQRITSLYGIVRGRPPRFFDGNEKAFTDLRFHLEDEVFERYGPVKMRDDPLWIDVTELMQKGLGPFVTRLAADPALSPHFDRYVDRLNAVVNVKDIDLHVEEVVGERMTVDVVVEIFNTVNSGGTKLSKGDLALAKICAEWSEARAEMRNRLKKWERAGFNFKLDWLLRNVNTILTGEAMFSALENVSAAEFSDGLDRAETMIDRLLELIASRLGLDHNRVLGSRYSFPLLAKYLADRDGRTDGHEEIDRLLYWYVHTLLWGRYSGSTETVLNLDLSLIEAPEGALDRLIEQLRRDRGDLRLTPEDFSGWSRGARFYPLLYMLTRVWHARDWGSGIELRQHLLGRLSSLQLHHIFPRKVLYRHGYQKSQVNSLANFTFLTQDTNLRVSARLPSEYLPEFERKHPGAVASHWIPMDPDLWRVENYEQFLAARRTLLAEAANDFLDGLVMGSLEQTPVSHAVQRIEVESDEDAILQSCQEWLSDLCLPQGEPLFELRDPRTGEPSAYLDLAWPEGLQEGFSQPVALLIDEDQATEDAANHAGYRYFTDLESFKEYVRKEVLALEPDTDEEVMAAPWKRDGRAWHLDHRCGSKTRDWLVVLDRELRERFQVAGPRWEQKLYVAYDVEDRTWLRIHTGTNQLMMDFFVRPESLLRSEAAAALGVVEFDRDEEFAEKMNLPSSVALRHKSRKSDRIRVRVKEDLDVEGSRFWDFVQRAYEMRGGEG